MVIPDKKDSIKQPAHDVYFFKKMKKRRVRNVQKRFFIKRENFSHIEST